MAAASAIFIPLALWGVSLDEAWRLLQQSDWRAFAIAVGLFVFTLFAKTARWQAFFQPRPPLTVLFAALTIGQAGNFLLPARLGDVGRVYVLGRRGGQRLARTAGTIAAEKLVELAALIGLGICIAPFVPLPEWLLDPSRRLGVIVAGAAVAIGLVFLQRARLRRLWSWVGMRFFRISRPQMEQQFDLTLQGFAALSKRERVLEIVMWSAVIWGAMIATNYALSFALPMQPSWLMSTVLLLVLQVGVAVPSTPGKIGVFQALVSLTLALFGIGRELAFSYGLLLYLVITVPQVVTAGPFLWQEITTLRRLRQPAHAELGKT
jgi:glycosyltransferase 2 family protein